MKGTTIRQRLSRIGMTQVEVARLLGVTPQTVNKILHTTNVQTSTLERLCEALHVPITFFYDDDTFQQGENVPEGGTERKGGTAGYERSDKVTAMESPATAMSSLSTAAETISTATSSRDGETVLDDSVCKIWETSRLKDKVRSLLKSQHKKFSVLYRHVGMTDAGLRRAFERDSCNVSVLLKMAEFFNVPVTYFLPEDRYAKAETEKDREIQYLKGQLKAYETALATVLQGIKGTENADFLTIHTAN